MNIFNDEIIKYIDDNISDCIINFNIDDYQGISSTLTELQLRNVILCAIGKNDNFMVADKNTIVIQIIQFTNDPSKLFNEIYNSLLYKKKFDIEIIKANEDGTTEHYKSKCFSNGYEMSFRGGGGYGHYNEDNKLVRHTSQMVSFNIYFKCIKEKNAASI